MGTSYAESETLAMDYRVNEEVFEKMNDREKLSYICKYLDSLENGFDEEEFSYLRNLIPAYDIDEGDSYIFISYSHKDYKRVFRDLAYFTYGFRKGRFWYDAFFEIGINWRNEAKKHILDKKCAGVVFYISENMVFSKSVLNEVQLVIKSRIKPYCAISLSKQPTIDLILDNIAKKTPWKYNLFCLFHPYMITIMRLFFHKDNTTLYNAQIQTKVELLNRKFHVFSEDVRRKKRNSVLFGKYPFGSNSDIQPIEWLELDRREGKILLISRYGIDNVKFSDERIATSWENSSVRKWLNTYFYSVAFTRDEQERILLTDVDNSSSIVRDNTKDYLFLLSTNEAETLFVDNNDRMLNSTPYAVSRGAFVNNDSGYSSWRLRSQHYDEYHSSFVHTGGSIDYECGYPNDYKNSTVRPAMWLKCAVGLYDQ